MFLNKHLLVLLTIISIRASAQNNILSNYSNNPNYTVSISDDSVVSICENHSHRQWEKRISVYPEGKITSEANLIIELDTVNYLSYES